MSVDLPIWRAPVMSATGESAMDRSTRGLEMPPQRAW